MELDDILYKNKITIQEMDLFSEILSSKPTLKALCKSLSDKVDEKKAFVIAKVFSETIIGMEIEDYAPDLIEDRNKILKKDRVKLAEINKVKKQIKSLRSIDEDMTFYILERKMKVTK